MNQRTDFWEWYEQLFRTPQVISQEVKAPVSKTGNAGSNPASSAKIKRAFSHDESPVVCRNQHPNAQLDWCYTR